jgi:uncharacterized cupredoxin-like copper-binding protein
VGTKNTSKKTIAATVTALALGLMAAGCGTSTHAADSPARGTAKARATVATIPTLNVTAKDYSFDLGGGTSASAGRWRVHLVNAGTEDHQAQIARIDDGVTQTQIQAAAAQGAQHALGLVTLVGGPNTVAPGASQDVVVDLTPGHYLLLCFVPSPTDHKAHADKGMVLPFEVTAATATAPPAPEVAGTVTLSDYQFDLPADLGHGTFAVENKGTQAHELGLVRLGAGKTVADLEKALAPNAPPGPPPFSSVGGAAAIAPGHTEWVDLDLAPGNYVAICFVPDAKDGLPHFLHGMVHPFTVT